MNKLEHEFSNKIEEVSENVVEFWKSLKQEEVNLAALSNSTQNIARQFLSLYQYFIDLDQAKN